MKKLADLLPNVQPQPHQERLWQSSEEEPARKLLVHALGSGKTLTSIGAAEAHGEPYTAVVPASLRPNFKGEQAKFTDQTLPSQVMSYNQMAQGNPIQNPSSLIFDESHRLRNPATLQTQQALAAARKAKQVLMLSGSPIVNEPSDLAVPTSMLTGKNISPGEFAQRYVGEKEIRPSFWHRLMGVTPGIEKVPQHTDELKALLKGHVDYYSPDKPVVPTTYEDHTVEMGKQQSQLYNAMFDRLPWHLRWKLKMDFPLSKPELQRMTSFMTGPRQVGLSTYPYMREKDPHRAMEQSPKLQKAMGLLQERLKDERTKALVFSNFIDAGLTPYAAALGKAGIPHAVFHGGLSDVQRKRLVEDYNTGKIRAALLGPSGSEGLSFRGTNLVQLLDQYWNSGRGRQSIGRGLRFDSHLDSPEDLKNLTVQRFISRLPLGFKDRMLARLGFDKSKNQLASDDYLKNLAGRKDKLNNQFNDIIQQIGTPKIAADEAAKHIFVTGHSGAGKSTLAKSLSEQLGMPLIHLDDHPDWKALLQEQKTAPDFGWTKKPDMWQRYVEVRRNATLAAAQLPKSHIIEGTQMLAAPEATEGHQRIIVDTPDQTIIRQRLARQRAKMLADPMRDPAKDPGPPGSAKARAKAQKGRQLIALHQPELDAFRKLPGVETVARSNIHSWLARQAVPGQVDPSVVHGVGAIRPRPARPPELEAALAQLRKARQHSDAGQYDQKNNILRQLMQHAPGDFKVDEDTGTGLVGIVHQPLNYRMHTLKRYVPTQVLAPQA